jgi:hypothetical protein
MEFDVAGEPVTQVTLDDITQVIISLFANVVDVYVEFVAPVIFVPFFIHWYVGNAPPLLGVAMNVTLDPEQIATEGFDVISILATTFDVTLMVIELDVAGEPVTHEELDVITQMMISLFARAVEEYVEFVAPAMLVPFFFHW